MVNTFLLYEPQTQLKDVYDVWGLKCPKDHPPIFSSNASIEISKHKSTGYFSGTALRCQSIYEANFRYYSDFSGCSVCEVDFVNICQHGHPRPGTYYSKKQSIKLNSGIVALSLFSNNQNERGITSYYYTYYSSDFFSDTTNRETFITPFNITSRACISPIQRQSTRQVQLWWLSYAGNSMGISIPTAGFHLSPLIL